MTNEPQHPIAKVIPLFVQPEPEPAPVPPAKCSFCLTVKQPGTYISDGFVDSPVICFDCVRLAKQKLDEDNGQ